MDMVVWHRDDSVRDPKSPHTQYIRKESHSYFALPACYLLVFISSTSLSSAYDSIINVSS